MKKNTRIIPNTRSYSAVIIILVTGAIALFLLKNSINDNKKDIVTESPPSQNVDDKSKTQQGEQKDEGPAAEATPAAEMPPTPAPLPDAENSPTEIPCKQAALDIQHFLAHLEQQEYIKAYALDEPLPTYLNNIIIKILDTPPVNDKETTDLSTILKNASHFYRILGIKDLSLLKDILEREPTAIEQQLAALFAFSTQGEACRANSAVKFQSPLAKSYEYAAFFLNTLGGQSYLARRDSTVRLLIRYYSALIIHQAAQQSINRYNINLPYHVAALTRDIANMDFLENQALYLATLQKIKTDGNKRFKPSVVPAK
jgi:hypothetical protein